MLLRYRHSSPFSLQTWQPGRVSSHGVAERRQLPHAWGGGGGG